jgi:ankyrin repeat protein
MASKNGHTEVVKLLLEDERVDPSTNKNWAIRQAYKREYINVIKLLLKHSKVKETLQNKNIYLYNKLIQLNIKSKIEDF